MAARDLDELEALMPRTKAANERAQVDARNLRQYMEASKLGTPNMISKRSSVMVRGDVRKDDQGFEDIDEFWADDDDFDPKDDDDDDDDDPSVSERDVSANVSMGSMTSERRVRLSGLSTQSNEYDFGNDGNLSTDTMDLDDEPELAPPVSTKSSTKSAKEPRSKAPSSAPATAMATPVRAAPKAASPRFSKRSTASSPAPSHDFNMSMSFDTGSAMKAIPIPSKRDDRFDLEPVRQMIARKSLPPLSPIRAPPARDSSGSLKSSDGKRKRDLFGDNSGFQDGASSPFSPGVSPLSNASERDLDEIKFSAKRSGGSPIATKKLFKRGKLGAGEKRPTKGKSKATAAASKGSSKAAKPAKKKVAKRSKSTAASDDSTDQQTDNDKSVNANTSDEDKDNDNDSDFEVERAKKKTREGGAAYARNVFDDSSDGEDEAAGVRRSKRRRFKPLAWYKGEHYIYERRESGVGLVIPTVAGIERAGTSTPTKTARKYTKRVGAAHKATKAFPKSQLPKDLHYEKGEWANLYDTTAGCVNRMNVICRASEIEHRELPSVDGEQSGFAGQSFNLRNLYPFSRWICGRLGLPPGAAKEAESVGDAVQVFYVTSCQSKAVEVAFGPVTDEYFDTSKATRFLLHPGDEFYVPSRNAYYLKNYSATTACELHFTIMKPDLPATVVTSAADADASTYSGDDASPDADASMRRSTKATRLKS